MSERIAIVDAIRTPIGKKSGSLANWRPDDLAAEIIKGLVQRNDLKWDHENPVKWTLERKPDDPEPPIIRW
jgi:acetyl-CoA acetyltransferase